MLIEAQRGTQHDAHSWPSRLLLARTRGVGHYCLSDLNLEVRSWQDPVSTCAATSSGAGLANAALVWYRDRKRGV